MTERTVRLFAEHVGEIEFDGIHAVVSALDVGYPEIKRVASETSAIYSARTHALKVGAGELVLEGYLLGSVGLPDSRAGGTAGLAGERELALAAELAGAKARLMAICAPGQEFFLEVGNRRRALYASGLTFCTESPFNSGAAEKFRLSAFSDVPFFRGEEIAFAGAARTDSALSFPASGTFSTAVANGTSDILVRNDGDERCGFVLEAEFAADSMHFVLTSNREDGVIHIVSSFEAGEKILISTVPGDKYVKREDGTNLIANANESCVFHTLPPGETCLTFRSYSSVPPVVLVRFTPGYLIP